jgi:hypothetical protein
VHVAGGDRHQRRSRHVFPEVTLISPRQDGHDIVKPRSRLILVAILLVASALTTMHVYASSHARVRGQHGEAIAPHFVAAVAGVRVDPMPEHGLDGAHVAHALAQCLWLLLTGLIVVVLARQLRRVPLDVLVLQTIHTSTTPSQRAPPHSTRLSLIGILRH